MNRIWKILVVVNLAINVVIAYVYFQLYEDRNNLRVELFLEVAKQDILIKSQENIIFELQKTIDELNRRMSIYEISRNYDYDSDEIHKKGVIVQHMDSKNKSIESRESNYDFSNDMGDCSGVGDGIIGLFVDVFTKCPGNVFGYSIKVN